MPQERLSSEDVVRIYQNWSRVERAFRTLKSIDLKVRPIRHWVEDRVRAHIFLCMLAYYVEWHMIEAWRPLLFADEDQEGKKKRDPVAPARRSKSALAKVESRVLADGTVVHSFQTLIGCRQYPVPRIRLNRQRSQGNLTRAAQELPFR